MHQLEEFKSFDFEPVGKCLICGSNSFKIILRKNYLNHSFQWVRCAKCAFVFQNPRLTVDSLRNLYNSFAYLQTNKVGKDKGVGYQDYFNGEDYRLRQSDVRINKVAQFIDPPARLLDIACATGFFMKVARDYGYEVEGIDISEKLASWGKEYYGLNIRPQSFEECEFDTESYDLVTIWGAADSNFYDPQLVYTKINRILKSRGYLFFNFHDFDHPLGFLKGTTFKKSPTALYNFNRRNLRTFLENAGFRIVKMEHEFQYTSLEQVLNFLSKNLLDVAIKLGLNHKMIRIPIPGGYFLAAQKETKMI